MPFGDEGSTVVIGLPFTRERLYEGFDVLVMGVQCFHEVVNFVMLARWWSGVGVGVAWYGALCFCGISV